MDHTRAIVVGVGDTSDGHRELDWAADEAQGRNCPLHVVRAYYLTESVLPWQTPEDRSINSDLRAAAQKRLDAASAYLAESWPRVDVKLVAVDGSPAKVMCDASRAAELTVVGSRRLGALGSAVLGSVGGAVAAGASGPVVVVRSAPGDPAEVPQVIVGIDGSDVTADVLDFAFEFAGRRKRELRVLYCWRPGLYPEHDWSALPPAPERAERWLAEVVAGPSAGYPDVTVHRVVVRDHAVDRLVADSHSQEMLVVGAHRKHPRIATLLGSVTQGVLHHATSPVAVAHPA